MPAPRVPLAAAIALAVLVTASPRARAAGPPPDVDAPRPPEGRAWTLDLFAAPGLLGSAGGSGGAFLTGLRLGLGRHFAGGVDVGYGLMSAAPGTQDRWWMIPTAALVIPVGAVRLDLGAGAGVGTSSGYVSWSAYAAGPFAPVWHYTVPAARAHAGAAIDVGNGVDLFVRLDLASLPFVGSQAAFGDTTWLALWFGAEPRLLASR